MSQDFFYAKAYGLTWRSTLKLPYFYQCSTLAAFDVELVEAKVSARGLSKVVKQGLFFQVNEHELWLHVPHIARFLVQQGQRIVFEPYPGIDQQSLAVFLAGPCMAALLMQRDLFVLTGGVVKVNDAAMAFFADECSGKSSLLAFMAQRGYLILADNLCVLNKEGLVLPGPQSIELWENSLATFNLKAKDLMPIRAGINKYYWSPECAFYSEPLSLKHVYVFNPHKKAALQVCALKGGDKIKYLQKSFYNKAYLEGFKKNALYFQYCAQLAQRCSFNLLDFDILGFDVHRIGAAITVPEESLS